MLLRAPLKTTVVVMGMEPFGHDAYKSKYIEDTGFEETYMRLK